MGKKEKQLRRERKFDEQSDARTADFIMRRLDGIESDLSDLVPDVQTLRRYDDMTTLAHLLCNVKRLRKHYKKLADGFSWREEDD